MMNCYGFCTAEGFKGRMPDGRMQLFATEQEYHEALQEESERPPPGENSGSPDLERPKNAGVSCTCGLLSVFLYML